MNLKKSGGGAYGRVRRENGVITLKSQKLNKKIQNGIWGPALGRPRKAKFGRWI